MNIKQQKAAAHLGGCSLLLCLPGESPGGFLKYRFKVKIRGPQPDCALPADFCGAATDKKQESTKISVGSGPPTDEMQEMHSLTDGLSNI